MLTLNLIGKKRCAKCGENRPQSLFSRDRGRPDGRYPHCKPCAAPVAKEALRRYRATSKYEEARKRHLLTEGGREVARAAQDRYRDSEKYRSAQDERRPKERERGKRKYASNKESYALYAIRKKYGITAERYQGMLATQMGLCAICMDPPERSHYGRLYVDHDHSTGVVRGLLCHACNAGIGMFRDSPERMARAIEYVKLHAPQETP